MPRREVSFPVSLRPFPAVGLLWTALLLLAACAAPPRHEVPGAPAAPPEPPKQAVPAPSPASATGVPSGSTFEATLAEGVPLEWFGGFNLGLLSLHRAQHDGSAAVAIVLDRGDGSLPWEIYLPATVGREPGGHLVRLLGDGGATLPVFIPDRAAGALIEATWLLTSLDLEADTPDGRREVLNVQLDRNGDMLNAELRARRLGPPRFGPFGRPVLEDPAPITLRLDRDRGAERAQVWLGNPMPGSP